MENTGPLWTSPYTISSSAINTWLGEELRAGGVRLGEKGGRDQKQALHYDNATPGDRAAHV